MTDVYNFSYEEFCSYIDSIRAIANRVQKQTHLKEIHTPKEFGSIEELDEYYHSTDAIEFFKNEMLS